MKPPIAAPQRNQAMSSMTKLVEKYARIRNAHISTSEPAFIHFRPTRSPMVAAMGAMIA